MGNPDLLLCAFHVAIWAWVGAAWLFLRSRGSHFGEVDSEPAATSQEYTAPFSRSVLGFHFFGFAVLYVGIANAVFPGPVPLWFSGQRAVGALFIATGMVLISWTVASFHSWRLRARLDQGHKLATGGAFRLLRHPIYAGVNLAALGSAIWAPDVITWCGFVLIVLGSELRARTEEALLRRAFGIRYDEYCRRTKRFIPGVY